MAVGKRCSLLAAEAFVLHLCAMKTVAKRNFSLTSFEQGDKRKMSTLIMNRFIEFNFNTGPHEKTLLTVLDSALTVASSGHRQMTVHEISKSPSC